MTSCGYHRGHPIYWDELTQVWRYRDNKKPTNKGYFDRACAYCGVSVGRNEPDPCLGFLPGVSNACCGHGNPDKAYIQFDNGMVARGIEAFEKPQGEV